MVQVDDIGLALATAFAVGAAVYHLTFRVIALLAQESSSSRIEARLAGAAQVSLKHSYIGRFAPGWRRSRARTAVFDWLQRAGWSDQDLAPGSIIIFVICSVVVGGLLLGSALKAGILTVLVACGFLLWARSRSRARSELFAQQLPGVIRSISAGLAAGLSLPQALDNASTEAEAPASHELRTISEQMALGLPFDEALRGLRSRVPMEELDTLLLGLAIQRRSGGNLVEMLKGISQAIKEKRRIRSNLRVETAQARMSAGVIGVMPVLVALGVSIVDPAFISPLIRSSAGLLMTATAVILEVAGFLVLRQILEIDA